MNVKPIELHQTHSLSVPPLSSFCSLSRLHTLKFTTSSTSNLTFTVVGGVVFVCNVAVYVICLYVPVTPLPGGNRLRAPKLEIEARKLRKNYGNQFQKLFTNKYTAKQTRYYACVYYIDLTIFRSIKCLSTHVIKCQFSRKKQDDDRIH